MYTQLKQYLFLFFAFLIVTMSTAQEDTLFTLIQDEPIISAGDGGEWAQRLHNSGAVTFYEGQFHMFRNSYPSLPGNSVIGYATSQDAIEWTHYADNPVLRADDVSYADMIMASSVHVETDGTWVLYFLIWDTAEVPGAIGRAMASDPTGPWAVDDAPVLTHGIDGTWDSAQVTQPSVLINDDGDGYTMYYTGVDASGINRVGMATSFDGISWTKYDNAFTTAPLYAESDPILQPGSEGDWDASGVSRGRVVKSEDGYVMIFRTPASGSGFIYGIAISHDGIEWHKYSENPILSGQDISDAGSLFFPTFVYHDNTYYFFIEGFSGTSRIYLLTLSSPLTLTTQRPQNAMVSTLVQELPSATGGLAVDADGNIYAASIGLAPGRNGTEIYRITPEGGFELWVQDDVLRGASGNTFDAEGNLYQSSLNTNAVYRISPDGTVEEYVSEGIRGPVGLVMTDDNTLYVANCRGNSIQRVSSDGKSEVFASGSLLGWPNGMTADPNGNFYVSNFRDGRVIKITPDGDMSLFANLPGGNNAHLIYHDGLLYVVARGAQQIYTLTLDGQVKLFAGTRERGHEDGSALEATFNLPNDIVVSPDGRFLYVNEAFPDNGLNIPSTIRVIELP